MPRAAAIVTRCDFRASSVPPETGPCGAPRARGRSQPLSWRLPEGGEATWESRQARKRGAIAVRAEAGGATTILPAPPAVATRLRRLNWVAAVAFTIGGSLFALGAAVAQLGSGDATTAASIYFAGGLFFNTGGYASLLRAINAPRGVGADGTLTAGALALVVLRAGADRLAEHLRPVRRARWRSASACSTRSSTD